MRLQIYLYEFSDLYWYLSLCNCTKEFTTSVIGGPETGSALYALHQQYHLLKSESKYLLVFVLHDLSMRKEALSESSCFLYLSLKYAIQL